MADELNRDQDFAPDEFAEQDEQTDVFAPEEGAGDAAGAGEGPDSAGDADGGEPQVRPFDFNRPYSLSKVFEKNLQSICEGFVKASGLGLTNQFRANTTVEFQGIELGTYRDFHSELPNPTCVATVSLAPLKGLAVIHFDLGLSFSLMEKMLGGPIEPGVDVRKYTDIELGLSQSILTRLLDHLKTGAARMIDLNPAFVSMENNPVYLNAMPAGEAVLLLNFALSIDDVTGAFSFCIPHAAFEPVKDKLDPDETPELRSPQEVGRDRGRVLDLIQGTRSDLVVDLGEVEMNVNRIMSLQEGDLLPLGKSIHSPLEVRVQGKPVFHAVPGRRNRFRAVKITERLREED